MPAPFAFTAKKVGKAANEVKKTIEKKMQKPSVIDNFLNQNMVKEVKKH